MRRFTNEIVMFLGISIAIGGFFPDFRGNQLLVVSVTFAAVIFAVFDLVVSFNTKAYLTQQLLLFAGVFSIIVLPYLKSLATFFIEQNNFLTLIGLAIVIFLIGYRQRKQEKEDYNYFRERFEKQTQIIQEQNKVIKEQTEILKLMADKNEQPRNSINKATNKEIRSRKRRNNKKNK